MKRKFFVISIILLFVCPAFAEDIMDSSKLNIKPVQTLEISGLLSSYVNSSPSKIKAPEYNLERMKQINPDFTTYPEADGIIWLKHVEISPSGHGGMEVTRLYVILGRRGLGGKWLEWNIPVPEKGSIEVLEANVYDFTTLARILRITPEEDSSEGICKVHFMGLPDTFIITIAWHEVIPDQLSFEGLCWFQEDLRVWESITEIFSTESLVYNTFPERRPPETQRSNTGNLYTWRRINLDPYNAAGILARIQRSGLVFSTRRENIGTASLLKEIENAGNISAPDSAVSGFKRSKEYGTQKLLEWLKHQPEIELAEGSRRKIPTSGEWTREEKILLANSWLNARKIESALAWQLPFDPDDLTPLCKAMFYNPVLEVHDVKNIDFHDIVDRNLLAGVKIFNFSGEGKLISRRIPESKSAENRLSVIMDLKVSDFGLLNGKVRIILRGAWGVFMLGNNPTDGAVRGALLLLFPGLTNYNDVNYKSVKGIPEISFTVENKPGVAGSGRGILAILPFFEPVPVRALGTYDPPVEVKFPFVIDQNITLGFPKNAKEALVSGKTDKNPDKINFSSNYQNRRHRLISDARFELNMSSVSSGNMALLRRYLDQWRNFSARHIPVR